MVTQQEIEANGRWFQNITFPNGLETVPGSHYPKVLWDEALPLLPDVHGKSVLDIGCNGGYMAVELAKMGASVTAIDNEPLFVRQTEFTKKAFGLEYAVHQADVQHLDDHPGLKGRRFDLILLFGVIYHVENPVLAMQNCMAKTKDCLLVETAINSLPGSVAEFLNYPAWDQYIYTWHPSAECMRNLIRYTGGVISANSIRPSAPTRQFFKVTHGESKTIRRLYE
jgi:tRNA (mo5U34)-methyltransferase